MSRGDLDENIGCAVMLGMLALYLAFWGGVIYVVLHFIFKYW